MSLKTFILLSFFYESAPVNSEDEDSDSDSEMEVDPQQVCIKCLSTAVSVNSPLAGGGFPL